jgi:small subunit ribosomal protein S25e
LPLTYISPPGKGYIELSSASLRQAVGGTKKKTLASAEKEQERKAEEEKPKEKKGGKGAKPSRAIQPQYSLSVREEEALEQLAPLKAITIYSAAKTLGVKASISSNLLRSMAEKGLLDRVGGFSGHYVYAVKKK